MNIWKAIKPLVYAIGITFWVIVGCLAIYGLATRCENEYIYRNCSGE